MRRDTGRNVNAIDNSHINRSPHTHAHTHTHTQTQTHANPRMHGLVQQGAAEEKQGYIQGGSLLYALIN